jgi:16S rRNA (uracil1498-N3)-methyltransferase
MHVFFQPDLSPDFITLSEEESKHCIRVLRMQKGDQVHLADGKGIHALAVINEDHPKKCVLEIREKNKEPQSRSYEIHLAVAPTKNSDRMDWLIEKAVECGVDSISFVECENSERSKVNIERCEKIAISAMKQSKQWWLPELKPLVGLKEWLTSRNPIAPQLKLVAWVETGLEESFSKQLKTAASQRLTILIGPEGDFTEAEVKAAAGVGFLPVSLGESVLRTETAALYACMVAKAIWGN